LSAAWLEEYRPALFPSTFFESSGTTGPADHANGGEAAVSREWVAAGDPDGENGGVGCRWRSVVRYLNLIQ